MPEQRCWDYSQTFEQLNSDCLFHLYEFLSPLDIANASEACTYLSDFARENIYQKYEDFRDFGDCIDAESYERLLKHFGANIHRLGLNKERLVNGSVHHIMLALKYCPNLEELGLMEFFFSEMDASFLERMKCQVRHVILMFCKSVRVWADIFNQWPNVRAVTIHQHGSYLDHRVIDNVITLEELSLYGCTVNLLWMRTILQSQSNTLRSLTLIDMPINYNDLVLWAPNVERLKISINHPSQMRRLCELKHLRHLKLKLRKVRLENNAFEEWSLKGLDTVNELDLIRMPDAVIRAAADVKSLRVLRIRYSSQIQTGVLADTIAKLPNLEHLCMYSCNNLMTGDDLANIVGSNRNLKQIDYEQSKLPCETISKVIETLSRQYYSNSFDGQRRSQFLLNVTSDLKMDSIDRVSIFFLRMFC